jgi:hypothetical protein
MTRRPPTATSGRDQSPFLTGDVETSSLLAEQRATGATRTIPTRGTVTAQDADARVEMMVKTDTGVFAKAGNIRSYRCQLLARIQGGGRAPTGRTGWPWC